jgi:hypothetical protein
LITHDADVEAEPIRFLKMTFERTGSVRKHETALRGYDRHVCSVVVTIGNEDDARFARDDPQIEGVRKIGVSDDDALYAALGEISDAFVDGAVETAIRFPKDLGAD